MVGFFIKKCTCPCAETASCREAHYPDLLRINIPFFRVLSNNSHCTLNILQSTFFFIRYPVLKHKRCKSQFVEPTCYLGSLQIISKYICLLYTSDAADDLLCVDLGGRRI